MSHPTTKGRKKGGHAEEHENHERWLVSYADMLTLLFALFIVLYAMGQTDQKKYEALAAGLAAGFGAPTPVFEGGTGPLNNEGIAPRPLNLMTAVVPPKLDPELGSEALKAVEEMQQAGRRRDASQEADRLKALKRAIEATLEKQGLKDKVVLRIDERGLVVRVVTDDVLFAAHRAELQTDGQRVLGVIGPVLRSVPNRIDVEGHTNTADVKPIGWSSDTALSAARATSVVDFLAGLGVNASRMTATGYGNARPLVAGQDARAHRLNRRVEVVLLSTLPTETRALLPEFAGEQPAAKPETAPETATETEPATETETATETEQAHEPEGGDHG